MKSIKEKNIEIAKMMGWFQQDGHRETTWFEKGGSAIYVASQKLSFDSDWNELMKALEKIRHFYHVGKVQSKNGDKIVSDRFSINIYGIFMTLWHYSTDGNPLEKTINFRHVPNSPETSNSESFQDAVFNAVFKFSEYINLHGSL